MILCPTDGGYAHAMTEDHHAEARGESARLRRLGGSGIISDSFGETRYVENRALPRIIVTLCLPDGWEHWQTREGEFR